MSLGRYLPGPPGSTGGDFWVGDTVRVHTGQNAQDIDEQDFRVMAVNIAEEENAELTIIPELVGLPDVPPEPGEILLTERYEGWSTTSNWGRSLFQPAKVWGVSDPDTYTVVVAVVQGSFFGVWEWITYIEPSGAIGYMEIDNLYGSVGSTVQQVAISEYLTAHDDYPTGHEFWGGANVGAAAVGCLIAEFTSTTPFTRVQHAQAAGDTVVLGSDPTAGNLLILSVAAGVSSGSTNAIPDQSGWTETGPEQDYWSTDQFHLRQWYKTSAGAADKTTVVDDGGNANVITSIIEYSNA